MVRKESADSHEYESCQQNDMDNSRTRVFSTPVEFLHSSRVVPFSAVSSCFLGVLDHDSSDWWHICCVCGGPFFLNVMDQFWVCGVV